MQKTVASASAPPSPAATRHPHCRACVRRPKTTQTESAKYECTRGALSNQAGLTGVIKCVYACSRTAAQWACRMNANNKNNNPVRLFFSVLFSLLLPSLHWCYALGAHKRGSGGSESSTDKPFPAAANFGETTQCNKTTRILQYTGLGVPKP